MHRLALSMLCLLLAGAVGCARDPQAQCAEIEEQSQVALNEAKAAAEADDADACEDAADRVEKYADRMDKLAAKYPDAQFPEYGFEVRAVTIRGYADEAVEVAALAREKHDFAALIDSWRGKAYRGSRDVVVGGLIQGLVLAAKEAESKGIDNLPQAAQQSARIAADVAALLASRDDTGDNVDWSLVVTDLESINDTRPHRLTLLMATSWLVSAQPRFALYEISRIEDLDPLTPDERAAYHLLRAIAMQFEGFDRLAVIELRTIQQLEIGRQGPLAKADMSEEELMAVSHLLLAVMYLVQEDYDNGYRELMKADAAWPNNPVGVFMTGERLLADGDSEAAAESLETAAADTRFAPYADLIAERARTIRADGDDTKPLADQVDFVRELIVAWVKEEAPKTKAWAQTEEWLAAAQAFGRDAIDKLPTLSGNGDDGEAPAVESNGGDDVP